MPGIFKRQQLNSSQLRTVADRRLADARCLLASGKNVHANGAMYLGGFVIECMLKAKLLEKHPWLRNASFDPTRQRNAGRLWSLCYRSHELDEILAFLPDLMERLQALDQQGRPTVLTSLKSICAEWTIYARYSPQMADQAEAREFLGRIGEIKEWLR